MKSVTAEATGSAAWADGAPGDIESECETWDWARTAGVSAAELREALRCVITPSPENVVCP